MKKISRLICSLFIAVILAFNTAIIPAMNVHASEYAALGLYELLQALLMSAGSSVCGLTNFNDFQLSDAAYDSLVTVVFQNNPTLAKYLAKANELDMDASFRAQLEAASEGEEFSYDDLKITKSKTGYKLQASKGLVSEAAKAIKEWADSDENSYETNATSNLEDYYTVSYSSSNVASVEASIENISSLYSSKVTEAIKEMGYDDSNCLVFSYNASLNTSTPTSGLSDDLGDWLSTGVVTIFIAVPFGYSFVRDYFKTVGQSNTSMAFTRSRYFKNDFLTSLPSYCENYGSNPSYEHIKNNCGDVPFIVYYPNINEIQIRELSYSSGFPFLPNQPYRLYNYAKAFENGAYFIANGYAASISNSKISVQSVPLVQHYITSGSSAQYANTDDYVSMDFDSTTAGTLASYSSLADYVKYAMSLSAQLSDIKDAIEDSTEQNAAQAKEIVSAINTQTDVISAGLSDVITSVKVQTDAISDVLEATKLQTDAIGDVIIGLDDVCSAIKDLSITLPSDLTLTIPEEKLNINVTVPDISTEVINNIEVKHDYLALQDSIAIAVSGVLADAFVPSVDVVDTTINNFNNKFGFVSDVQTNIENIKTTIFGIKPSPILKLPIAKPTSKYDYGLGDYFIIDVSWYGQYKKYGDTIIMALLWLMFAWRLFIKLPGIINGTSADFVQMTYAGTRLQDGSGGKKGGH